MKVIKNFKELLFKKKDELESKKPHLTEGDKFTEFLVKNGFKPVKVQHDTDIWYSKIFLSGITKNVEGIPGNSDVYEIQIDNPFHDYQDSDDVYMRCVIQFSDNQYFDDVKWKKGGESSRLIPGEIHTSVNKADGKNEVLIGFRNISIFHTRSSHELEEDVNKLRTAADIVRKDIKYLAEPVISKDDLMDYIQSMIDKFGYIVEYHKFQSGSVTVVLKSPTNIELSADLLSEVASTIKKLENHGFKVRIREIISGGSAVGNRGSLSIAIINSSSKFKPLGPGITPTVQ